jgi:hypothetical protein
MLLAARMRERHTSRNAPDHQSARRAAALGQFNGGPSACLAKLFKLEGAAAFLADPHLPRQLSHLVVDDHQSSPFTKAILFGLFTLCRQRDRQIRASREGTRRTRP